MLNELKELSVRLEAVTPLPQQETHSTCCSSPFFPTPSPFLHIVLFVMGFLLPLSIFIAADIPPLPLQTFGHLASSPLPLVNSSLKTRGAARSYGRLGKSRPPHELSCPFCATNDGLSGTSFFVLMANHKDLHFFCSFPGSKGVHITPSSRYFGMFIVS